MASVSLEHADGPADAPLVSRASIVILCAFLIGLVFADVLHGAARIHAIGGAAAGLIAFLALGYAARLKEETVELRRELKTVRKLEGRLDRHVPVRKNAVTGVVRRYGPNGRL